MAVRRRLASRLAAKIEPYLRVLGPPRRQGWVGESRAEISIGPLDERELFAFRRRIGEAAARLSRVRGVSVDTAQARVAFAFEPHAYTLEELERIVDVAEVMARLAAGSSSDPLPPEFDATLRLAAETLVDTLAMVAGLALQMSPLRPSALGSVAASVATITRSSTRLRKGVDSWLGSQRAELLMNLVGAAGTAAAERPLSSLVEVAHKRTLLQELHARRDLWQRFSRTATVEQETREPPVVEPRAVPLPPGPIEQYADRAWAVSLGGFALSFLTTRSFQRSVAALFGALPKPAVRGREAFASSLGRLLANRDVLVVAPEVLRRLDRIDCLVLDESLVAQDEYEITRLVADEGVDEQECRRRARSLFDADKPLEFRRQDGWALGPLPLVAAPAEGKLVSVGGEMARHGALVLGLEHDGRMVAVLGVELILKAGIDELIAEAHAAGMHVVVSSDDESVLQGLPVDDTVPVGAGLPEGVKRLQREGRVVCLVATGNSSALCVADCGIGMTQEGLGTPWGAHIICGDDLSAAAFLIRASVSARETAKQGVHIALGAATVGAIVAAGGLFPMPTRRVVAVVNAATLMSHFNGLRHASLLGRQPMPRPRDRTPWHALDARGVLRRLESTELGLSRDDIQVRGRPDLRPESRWSELLSAVIEELFNPLTPLLAAGAGLSAVAGSVVDASMVGGVVLLNAVAGGAQRYRTDRAIRDLARANRRRANVRRNGQPVNLDASQLVPGDVVLLEAGDVVPADCRIVRAESLEVDASSITGESLPVAKSEQPSFASSVADRSSMVYEGTSIAAGRGTAVVVAVGDETEASRGASAVRRIPLKSGVEERMRRLIDMTAPLALFSGAGLVATGWLRGRRVDQMIGSGVSLAVASVPEGLPLLATGAQLAAAKRLSARGALVRNARSIEALGRVDMLCVDKTGTLTQGRIELFSVSDGRVTVARNLLGAQHIEVVAAGMRATPQLREGASVTDPTDAALLRAAWSMDIGPGHGLANWELVDEVPFEPGRGYHAAVGRTASGGLLSVKGAPEAILVHCTETVTDQGRVQLDATQLSMLYAAASDLAWRGLRVLAVAERVAEAGETLDIDALPPLVFRGFLAFSDPVRPTASEALARLRQAGVRTVMITGDHPSTAAAIAGELALLEGRIVMSGSELTGMSDADLDARIGDVAVFARVTPAQKVRVVRALQRAGHVVAMVGDGANDAPAIRLANVGIAIGQQSTAAARAAADIILTDERVETLVDAIVEGRAMWASVRDAVAILVGGNLGEIAFTLGAGLIEGSSPLAARQLLLVNLLTDVAPAMAIALRPPKRSALASLAEEGPDRSLAEPLDRDITARAAVTAAGAGAAWAVSRLTAGRERAGTVGLLALVGTQLGQTIRSGGLSRPVLATSVLSTAALATIVQTPLVSHFFGCRPLGPVGWATAVGASLLATSMSPALPRIAERVVRRASKAGAPLVSAVQALRPALEAWPELAAAAEDPDF